MHKHHPFARLLALALCIALCFTSFALAATKPIELSASDYPVEQGGSYSAMEEVAVYLWSFDELPDNFITKRDAESLGWNNRAGNLWEVAPGCAIGGSHFGNYEGLLPDQKGRKWTECDINYGGGYRGAERLIYSNDGLIYYTADHYESFTQIVVVEDELPVSKKGW